MLLFPACYAASSSEDESEYSGDSEDSEDSSSESVEGSNSPDTDDGAPTDDGETGSAEFDPEDFCGDGVKQEWEECDDGNLRNDDGCNADCEVRRHYECVTRDRTSICTPICGDGRTLEGEECDDNNQTSGDGCSSDCLLEAGWECIRGLWPCFRENRCGDGVVDEWECCDDGNLASGDGCSDRCQVESADFPEGCTPMNCGNGILEPGEQCDNGDDNDSSFGGCTPECVWGPHCGDGIVQKEYEDCDDGNYRDDDGCPESCIIVYD